ncbi:hypothetical protein BH10PSE14_BH10PSE14_43460 [soil metagenome]
MVSLLLLAAAPVAAVQTPIDAERAFAADAQALGQWTAFRKWAADDATMFVPQPVKAQEFLRERKDPPKAIEWWPTAAWVSCDGNLAIDTGGWHRPDGSVGYFTTVWQRDTGGAWKWIVDSGDSLAAARAMPSKPLVRRASCVKINGPLTIVSSDMAFQKSGAAADESLVWHWSVGSDGHRQVIAMFWDGKAYVGVIDDKIAAPKP